MKATDVKFYIVERHCCSWLYVRQVAVIAEEVLLRDSLKWLACLYFGRYCDLDLCR